MIRDIGSCGFGTECSANAGEQHSRGAVYWKHDRLIDHEASHAP
jgi:hypothetical protein